MTNNSIFTRVLALMLCLIMLVGTLTACLNQVEPENHVGTTNGGVVTTNPTTKPTTTTTTTPTTGDVVEDDPVEDPVEPVDPNEIFSASTNILSDALIYGSLASDVVIGGAEMGALVPADVKVEAGASSLALSVKKVDEVLLSDALSTLDVHINGVALDNTVPMVVKLGAILEAGLGATELKLYHTENGVDNLMTRVNSPADFAIHNQYYYNAETGEVTIYIASFSVISAVKSVADVWDGSSDTSWYNENDTEFTLTTAEQFAGFRDLVDAGNTFEGKIVKLGADIDLDKKPFDPIGFGYYDNDDSDGKTNYRVFMGTFDGGNHTIYNLYENCWELDPDKTNYGTYTYSTAGAGLFASVKDATIKNIAINGAEVVFECVDMGVLVGYAQGECHFENIVISNAKIANYNRYTGGLVGEVSYGVDNNKDGYTHTFKNITIDSTVTVSGLWGSFGCGMGGVIGGKWGTATVLMENIVSAPVMDVYNDVVSAYQWYAFRGCGMLIGHTEEPYSDGRTSGNATATFLTCKNVNVYYGDWVDYNYYEFENQDNTTGQRYPWVRAEKGEYCEAFSNIRYGVPTHNGVKVSDLTAEELKAVATDYTKITFDQLYGADRGMYGTNKHEGVNVSYKSPKTFYIKNNVGWKNLILHYTYEIGEETWTTIPDGVELFESNGVYRVDLPVGAISFTITADGGYEVEFTVANLTEKGTYPVHEHNFDSSDECTCGAQKMTASVTIADYATANGWVNDKQYKEVVIGGIKVTAVGGGNTGKYYTNGNNWRIYQSEDATLEFYSESGEIVSIKITYSQDKNGVLTFGGSNITSDQLVYVNAKDITFGTGNTDSATNGQVRITAIEVVYVLEKHECNQNKVIEGKDATCTEDGLTEGAKCDVCGTITKEQETITAQGHTPEIDEAVSPKCNATGLTQGSHCKVCSEVIVAQETIETVDHSFGDNSKCIWCGSLNHEHSYKSVVTAPTCTTTGYTTYTCDCGDTYTDNKTPVVGHNFVDSVCTLCGSTKITYTFSNYTAGTQYAKNEEHVLDEYVTITTYDCHFTSELRIYSSSTNNGYAIIYSVNPITTIGVNAGNKADTINVYGSNDGVNWSETPVGTISVTSTSYKDYSANLGEGYNWIKLDVKGSNQVRLKSMTLTTVGSGSEGGDTGHTHSYTGEVTTAATCTNDGVMTYTCTCGEGTYTEAIEATGHSYANGSCTVCDAEDPDYTEGGDVTEPVEETNTLTFDNTSKRIEYSTSKQVWTENGITFTNNKSSSTSNVADYAKPVRLYASSNVVLAVEGGKITKIVFDCNSASYATALKNSIGTVNGATVTVSSDKVTVTFNDSVESFTIAKLTAQVRMDSITVTYTK